MSDPDFVLSISCPDRRGIVAEVTRFLFERNCNILDSQQFGDAGNGRFFMRVHCRSEGGIGLSGLEKEFSPIAEKFAMAAQFFDTAQKTRAWSWSRASAMGWWICSIAAASARSRWKCR